jgi:hypothetical protein
VGRPVEAILVSSLLNDVQLCVTPLQRLENIFAEFSYLFVHSFSAMWDAHFFNRAENTTFHLSFINLRLLRRQLFDIEERLKMQPSFILAGLGMALLLKASEIEPGAPSLRNRAHVLRDRAESALILSWRRGWIDSSMAEAALVSS